MYESNAPGSRVHMCKNFRASEYKGINKALYEWFRVTVSKNVYPSGTLLIDKAKEIATKLGKQNFKGSQGWLGKWKQRYNIKQVRVSGESGDVSEDTNTSWKECLPEIVNGYDEIPGIWTKPESSGKLYQSVDCLKNATIHGWQKSKKRVTVALFVIQLATKKSQ